MGTVGREEHESTSLDFFCAILISVTVNTGSNQDYLKKITMPVKMRIHGVESKHSIAATGYFHVLEVFLLDRRFVVFYLYRVFLFFHSFIPFIPRMRIDASIEIMT